MEIRFFDSLESTNNYCKLLDLNAVEEFTVICAKRQTAGVGQQGNTWVSEPYKNLTFSVILKPVFLLPSDQFQLTIALSVAMAEAIASLLPHQEVFIKWPNDIYVGDRKICGILTANKIHATTMATSVCGIGLNVNQAIFPAWLPNPTSLALLSGNEYDLDNTLQLVLINIKKCYDELRQSRDKHENPGNPEKTKNNLHNSLRDRYMSRLYRLGTESRFLYDGKEIRATITDVNPFGHLQLITASGSSLSCSIKEIDFQHNTICQ